MQVTVTPTTITLTPGGAPVVQLVTITEVPADVSVSQPLTVTVGTVNVSVNTTVNVDNPSPTVAGAAAAPDYTVIYSTPVQDALVPTAWTVEATYSA